MAEPRWLEVSLTVTGELAESVAEVLDRFASGGVVVESGVIYDEEEGEGTPVGPVKVYAYLPMDEFLEEKRQRLTEALWYLGRIQALPEPTFRPIQDEDWMAAWKKHYHPIPIGQRLLVLPAWIEQTDLTRIAVKIDPSMAFGTGTHPTTQLCLEAIEEIALTIPSRDEAKIDFTFIDIGCGSGILSIAALKLGALQALGVDLDEQAVKIAGENARANGITQGLELGIGSVKEILQGKFSLSKAPLVVANILAPVIIQLFDDGMGDLVLPDGVLILSGILAEQNSQVTSASGKYGFRLENKKIQGDWVCLTLKY